VRRPVDRVMDTAEIEALSGQVARTILDVGQPRWNADPEDVRRSVAKLVLTLVEFLRQLLERQALRRMDNGALDAGETERLGLALMRLEETVHEMAAQFGLEPGELNLDLGPLGRLI